MIKVGSDFSGIGAFNQALIRLGIQYKEVFACDMDKYARQTFIHNYGMPDYYPANVYDREIPAESLDIYMTSPPCQAFSLAGKRMGKEDKRGILFFNSLEFIEKNRPRFFIFENVKGLLSDDGGKTFSEWVNMLSGKSVNGTETMFPYPDSVPYHLYWKVLNAKEHGVPQNRERVFLIGIRDDADNNFRFPAEELLTKRLKDVLESSVDEKYFLSEKMIDCLQNYKSDKFQVNTEMINNTDLARSLRTEMSKMGRQDNYLKIKSATSKGYEEATEGDSINLEFPESETRRGRVGKGVAQTLDTGCNQGVVCGAIRGRGENNQQQLELNSEDYTNSITTVQKDNVIVHNCIAEIIQLNNAKNSQQRIYSVEGISPTILAGSNGGGQNPTKHLTENYKIRRLTPRECFRLMDFPDTFTWPVSDSQAYKQAGNSIVVNVLYKILKNLNI